MRSITFLLYFHEDEETTTIAKTGVRTAKNGTVNQNIIESEA